MQQITNKWILELLDLHPRIELLGKCHDCGADVTVLIDRTGKDYEIRNGLVWKYQELDKPFFKCIKCVEANPRLTNFQPTEVYSRVVGYLRPVKQWNKGKQQEFSERKTFKM